MEKRGEGGWKGVYHHRGLLGRPLLLHAAPRNAGMGSMRTPCCLGLWLV